MAIFDKYLIVLSEMNKFYITTFFLFFIFTNLNSQSFGVKIGLNSTNIRGGYDDENKSRESFHFGVLIEYKITNEFSFQPELIYSPQGHIYSWSEKETDTYKETFKLDYLNIPLIAKYYLTEGLSLEGGPQIGFLLSAKGEMVSINEDGKDISTYKLESVKNMTLGLNFGVGYLFDNGINFGARFNFDLSSIYKGNSDGDNVRKNNVLQFFVGYLF